MERYIKTVFSCFRQNNSGGYLMLNKEAGIGNWIIIEGLNKEHILQRLEQITEDYSDYCSCCGERWCDYIDEEDLTDEPTIYGIPVKEYKRKFSQEKSLAYIHYIDGTIEKVEIDYE